MKQPGLDMKTTQSELDMSYHQRYEDVVIPEAYERLLLDTYWPLLLQELLNLIRRACNHFTFYIGRLLQVTDRSTGTADGHPLEVVIGVPSWGRLLGVSDLARG